MDQFAEEELPTGISIQTDVEYGEILTVKVPKEGTTRIQLLKIEQPGIRQRQYRLDGLIRYENIPEPGFLEMWSHFEEQGSYFTRTLGEFGSMGKIQGSSDWRRVKLPFRITEKSFPAPEKLEVNLVLPEGGQVQFANFELIEGSMGVFEGWPKASHGFSWKSPGVPGAVVGIFGAFFGVLGGFYGWSRESGRGWIIMKHFPLICYECGAFSLCLAGYAIATGRTWEMTYSFGLGGILLISVVRGNEWYYRRLRGSAADAEVRKMRALDV